MVLSSKKIGICTFALMFALQLGSAQNANIEIQNEKAVNTAELEFSPTFYQDGIVFISTNAAGLEKMQDTRIQKTTMSILKTRRSLDGKLGKPAPFGKELTSHYHEGPVCFTAAANEMYFSRNTVENGKEKLAEDGQLKMGIYHAELKNGKWSEGASLNINSSNFDDCHPAVSLDGDILIFASNRKGGFGGMDLYISYRSGEFWGEPLNLGSDINTVGNEAFPFLHADNTLYFASDGQPGLGGFDLFQASFNGMGWSNPSSLGSDFNTKGDDFGLIIDLDKKNGYFSSNGRGGAGQDDIFSFHDKSNILANADKNNTFDISLVSKDTGLKVLKGSKVRIVNLDKINVIGQDDAGNPITLNIIDEQTVLGGLPADAIIEGETDEKGTLSVNLGPGKYLFSVSKDGFISKQGVSLVNKPSQVIEVILELLPAGSSDKMHLNTVVLDNKTQRPVSGSMLVFTDTKTGQQQSTYCDEKGNVDVYLANNTTYKVEAFRNNQKVGSSTLDTKTMGSSLAMEMTGNSLPVGTIIELPNIYYNFNDASLRPDARKDLAMVLALLEQYKDVVLEIGSHTDARGTNEYNVELSQARAESVVSFLVANGANADRLRAIGYGENQLRNICADGVRCDEKLHARNRRTEIKVISGIDQNASIRHVEGSLGLGSTGSFTSSAERQNGSSSTASTTSYKEYSVQPNSSGTMRYVVSGVFLEINNAENRLLKLLSMGYESTQITQFDGSPLYYVYIGKFPTLRDAVSYKSSFTRSTKEDVFIKAVAQEFE